jgi:hypothetical protein
MTFSVLFVISLCRSSTEGFQGLSRASLASANVTENVPLKDMFDGRNEIRIGMQEREVLRRLRPGNRRLIEVGALRIYTFYGYGITLTFRAGCRVSMERNDKKE